MTDVPNAATTESGVSERVVRLETELQQVYAELGVLRDLLKEMMCDGSLDSSMQPQIAGVDENFSCDELNDRPASMSQGGSH